jgi:hypothetical protein
MRKNILIDHVNAYLYQCKTHIMRFAGIVFLTIVLGATNLFGQVSVTASGEKLPDEGIDKIHDGSLNSKWLNGGGNTAWVKFEYSSAQVFNTYSLTSGNDVNERDPKDWTMSGSNDGPTWTLLDTRSNQSMWINRNSTIDFSFPNTTAYLFYKLNITDNHGDWIMQLSELSFSFLDNLDFDIPSVPAGLSATNITDNSFTLSWSPSTDKVGVSEYEVSQDGISIGTTSTTTLNVIGLTGGKTYSITVKAGNAIPNWSHDSEALKVKTLIGNSPVVTVTASGENAPNEGIANINDGNLNNKWLLWTSTAWVQFLYSSAHARGQRVHFPAGFR